MCVITKRYGSSETIKRKRDSSRHELREKEGKGTRKVGEGDTKEMDNPNIRARKGREH